VPPSGNSANKDKWGNVLLSSHISGPPLSSSTQSAAVLAASRSQPEARPSMSRRTASARPRHGSRLDRSP
jgi:hypothetical protein